MTDTQKVTKAFIRDENGNLLILKKKPSSTNVLFGEWDLPGGHIKEAEDIKDALEREVFEETGLYFYSQPKPVYEDERFHFFECPVSSKELRDIRLSKEHDSFEWISPKQYGERFNKSNLYQMAFSKLSVNLDVPDVSVVSESVKRFIKGQRTPLLSVYKPGLLQEVRQLHSKTTTLFHKHDLELMKTDVGKYGLYEGVRVPLECPFRKGTEFAVYIRDSELKVREIRLDRYGRLAEKVGRHTKYDKQYWNDKLTKFSKYYEGFYKDFQSKNKK